MQDLSQDIIGTNPKYPAIVNHDWLTPKGYDNYPSDNNSVRIVPKLADLWDHNQTSHTGIGLVPNLTVQDTRSLKSEALEVAPVIREAKRAMMSGLNGRGLADHLRARFSSSHIAASKEALAKISEEQGLLGNVYIDASAFTSASEAEQFFAQHRGRLAQYIVVNESTLNPSVVSVLASKFHKNVVATVTYDADLFNKYSSHLKASGKIASSAVIDSKEALRQAFLAVPVAKVAAQPSIKEEKKIEKEDVVKDLLARSEKFDTFSRLANEEVAYRVAKPIVEFAFQQMSKGKTGSDLKEMLRSKYAKEDLNKAAKFLAIVVKGSNPESVDQLVTAGKISEYISEDLKKMAKKYPVKQASYAEPVKASPTIMGFFYSMQAKAPVNNEAVKASVEALRKGTDISAIKAPLLASFTPDAADAIVAEAVREFNLSPAGIKANVAVKAEKIKVVEDLKEKQTLPDPSTIEAGTQEILGYYSGAEMGIDVDPAAVVGSVEVNGLFNRSGIDQTL